MDKSAPILMHVDLDAFFASVEQLDFPDYRGKPVIVCGTTRRGVVATASYEARKFGVHSALATRIARRLCPKGIFVAPRFERYKQISRQVFELLQQLTDQIERVSIDEAYLDVSEIAPTYNMAEALGRKMKQNVSETIGLTISAGVAPCKFIAKIASDLHKPDGLTIVRPAEIPAFLSPLPVGKIPGVGKVAEAKLHHLGAKTIEELAHLPRQLLQQHFGRFGPHLYDYARGIDLRPIVTTREPKGFGSENTFEHDKLNLEPLLTALMSHAEDVARRLRLRNLAARTVTLKLRYSDFHSITRSRSLDVAIQEPLELFQAASDLLRTTEVTRRPVRLIGLYAAGLEDQNPATHPDFFGMNM